MKRLHIHISVANLDSNIDFYSKLFGVEPSVVKEDYAKWMLDDPYVNFAISQRGAPLGLNHLGLQVDSSDALSALNEQLQTLQTEVREEKGTSCCYAMSDKYWIKDPQGIAWEQFHTLSSIPVFSEKPELESTVACCVPLVDESKVTATPCCTPSQTASCC